MRGVSIISIFTLVISVMCTQADEGGRSCKREKDCKWNENCAMPVDATEGQKQCMRKCGRWWFFHRRCKEREECKKPEGREHKVCMPVKTTTNSPVKEKCSTASTGSSTEEAETTPVTASPTNTYNTSSPDTETKPASAVPTTITNSSPETEVPTTVTNSTRPPITIEPVFRS